MLRSAGMESSIILSLVLMLKTLVSVEATALAFPHLPANTIIPTKNIATRTNTPPTLLHEASGFWLVQLRLILHRFPMEVIEFYSHHEYSADHQNNQTQPGNCSLSRPLRWVVPKCFRQYLSRSRRYPGSVSAIILLTRRLQSFIFWICCAYL